MGESLTQRRRVEDEGPWVVNSCQLGREWTVPTEEASANYVLVVVVIRRELALFGITGRKAHVGGLLSQG